MIVVADTSRLNYLVLIQAVDILPKLFDSVLVPPSVIRELSHIKTPQIVKTWAQQSHPWVNVVAPRLRLPSTQALDDGESDAISLAKERQIIDVLMDEKRGRIVAQREGLNPLFTLTVLERGAEAGLLALPQAIALLQSTSIRLPADKVAVALARDAARKSSPPSSP